MFDHIVPCRYQPKTPINKVCKVSAAMVRCWLEQNQEALQERKGKYRWTLEGDSKQGWSIVAHSNSQKWTDAKGATPREVLRSFMPWSVLDELGW
jgi:hypothetical protein